jgi:hypothetical protein
MDVRTGPATSAEPGDEHDKSCEQGLTRQRAIFLGWNDAAWGRPRRPGPLGRTKWYEIGYQGGCVYSARS